MNSMERGEAGENHLSDFEANTTVFFFFFKFILLLLICSWKKGSRSDLDISLERILSCIHYVLGVKDLRSQSYKVVYSSRSCL